MYKRRVGSNHLHVSILVTFIYYHVIGLACCLDLFPVLTVARSFPVITVSLSPKSQKRNLLLSVANQHNVTGLVLDIMGTILKFGLFMVSKKLVLLIAEKQR